MKPKLHLPLTQAVRITKQGTSLQLSCRIHVNRSRATVATLNPDAAGLEEIYVYRDDFNPRLGRLGQNKGIVSQLTTM